MGVHTCSYYCDRPECVRAQRDELRQAIEQAEDAVVAEREACAKLVEDFDFTFQDDSAGSLEDAARAIRARGTPVHASDISQERVDKTAKSEHEFECPRCGHCCKPDWVEPFVCQTSSHTTTTQDKSNTEVTQQEPVAWMCEANVFHSAGWKPALAFEKNDAECFRNWQPLYARPESCTKVGTNSGVFAEAENQKEKKEWVGLGLEMMRNTPIEFNRGALWAERWLKEKNNG